MSRVVLLVEGQTEEAFVNELLAPHYWALGVFLTPIIISTSPGNKGGVVSYGKVRHQVVRLCREHHAAQVTTMFDLYALPVISPAWHQPIFRLRVQGIKRLVFWKLSWRSMLERRTSFPT